MRPPSTFGDRAMQYLSSSAIHAVNYNPMSMVLTIWFTHGGHGYDYFGVPQSVFNGLLSAASAGEFFNLYIREQYAA